MAEDASKEFGWSTTESVALAEQRQTAGYWNTDGDLVIRQRCWPDDDALIIAADFVDRLIEGHRCPGHSIGGQAMTKAERFRRVRLNDHSRYLRNRYGHELPNDDAGRDDLYELLLTISLGDGADRKMRMRIGLAGRVDEPR